eukprot:105235_1
MGNTVEVTGKDIHTGKFSTKFSNDELQRLFRNFKSLDANNDGYLSKEEFLQIEALQQNPLVSRVLEIFDDDGNDKIDFSEFVQALSIFCANDAEEKKAKIDFAFRIYDVNNDGYISNGDLFRILKIMVGDNLNDTQLQQLVDRTILQADKDKDGKLSVGEFTNFIAGSDIESKLVIDFYNKCVFVI